MLELNWSNPSVRFVPLIVSFVCGVALGAVLTFPRSSSPHEKQRICNEEGKRLSSRITTSTTSSINNKTFRTGDEGVGEHRLDIPENAPDHCPGIQSQNAGKSEACSGCPNQSICQSGEMKGIDPSALEVQGKLLSVKRKIIVLSGKGGVGKSTVSSQLSWAFQDRGYHVGLLDIDVCGPSIPMMTGCKGADVHASADGWSPVYVGDNLAVMSIGFLLPDQDDAVIWRGPKKNGLIRQFLTDVIWGDLDILIVDTPPGTTDEHLSIVTYLKEAGIDGALIVTTPQEASLQDVRKEINFCKKAEVPVIGVIENMTDSVFDPKANGAKDMCVKMDVPYIGYLPLDRDLLIACEMGRSLASINSNSPALQQINILIDNMLNSHIQLPSPDQLATDEVHSDGVVQIP